MALFRPSGGEQRGSPQQQHSDISQPTGGNNSTQQQQEQQPNHNDEEVEVIDELPEFTLKQPFDPETATVYQQLYLRLPKYTQRWVYIAELERATTLVIVCSNHSSTGAKGDKKEKEKLDLIRDSMRTIIDPYAAYLITKEHTHIPILSYPFFFLSF